MGVRYQTLGPLNAGEGSRAILGLEIQDDGRAAPVVIIWVPDHALHDKPLLKKIRKETDHAAKLEHPNIVRVAGFVNLTEGYARVVEYADGESLRKLLEISKTLPPRIAARVVVDACLGTHYAHVAGNDDGLPLVHGDIRPETLLVSYGGVTKVTGYGALAFAPRETGGQRVKGRRVHSAPEQIIAGRDSITVTTDVYLLGVMLYECLTGNVPWLEQGDFFDQAVLTLPLPPATPGLIPESLQPVIEKACAKKAPQRYATPYALKEAIETAMAGQIATTQELSAFLTKTFPEAAALRAQRQQTIDAGIAAYVRKQWAKGPPTSEAVRAQPAAVPPPPPPVSAPPPAPAPKRQAAPEAEDVTIKAGSLKAKPRPKAAPPPSSTASTEVVLRAVEVKEPPPQRRRGTSPWVWALIGAAVIAASGIGVALIVSADEGGGPPPAIPLFDAGVRAPAVVVAAPVVDAGELTVDSGVAVAEVVDAGAPVPVAVADAGTPNRPVAFVGFDAGPVLVQVDIDCTPDVDLAIEDRVLGHTPWSGRLTKGKKVLKLTNKELGLSGTRVLIVGDEPISETYKFEKGSVVITGPEEAQVFIDGERKGTLPIRGEVPVWEGSHHIVVVLGRAKWNQSFTVMPNQRINFNVEMQE